MPTFTISNYTKINGASVAKVFCADKTIQLTQKEVEVQVKRKENAAEFGA